MNIDDEKPEISDSYFFSLFFFLFDLVFFAIYSPYFRRRSNALEGMFVASFVGVCSGIYIFKPLLDEIAANQAERKRREALEAASSSESASTGNEVNGSNSKN